MFIHIFFDVEFDSVTFRTLAYRFHDEFANPTAYHDRNWLPNTIKRPDRKKSIADSKSTHLEVSVTTVTFLFR